MYHTNIHELSQTINTLIGVFLMVEKHHISNNMVCNHIVESITFLQTFLKYVDL